MRGEDVLRMLLVHGPAILVTRYSDARHIQLRGPVAVVLQTPREMS
jgi:hypothetical protein